MHAFVFLFMCMCLCHGMVPKLPSLLGKMGEEVGDFRISIPNKINHLINLQLWDIAPTCPCHFLSLLPTQLSDLDPTFPASASQIKRRNKKEGEEGKRRKEKRTGRKHTHHCTHTHLAGSKETTEGCLTFPLKMSL